MLTNTTNLHVASRRNGLRRVGLTALLLAAGAFALPRPAAAASLQEVRSFGDNPSNAKMYIYVPDRLADPAPVLVAIHYCGGSANAYFTGTGYRALADQHGFIVIYPQTTSSDGCFDVHSDATLKHGGGSDSAAIVSMVRYTTEKYSADASRVYVTGTSSGAMMTNVLLGAYPDVFRAGAAFAGVPYGCFAGPGGWNSACAQGQITKTGQAWGDLVRAAYPGYTGPRPRVQLWHGDRDETLNFHNFGEAIKEWTNVLGVSETPTSTEQNTPQSGWTRTRYADAGGSVRVEAVLEAGMTHNLTVLAAEAVRFFGLDGAADPGGPIQSGAGGTAGNADAGAVGAAPGGGMAGSSGMGAGAPSGGAAGGNPDAGGALPGAPGATANAGGDAAVAHGGGAIPGATSDAGPSAAPPLGGDEEEPHSGHASGSCSVGGRSAGGSASATLLLLALGALLCSRGPWHRAHRVRAAASLRAAAFTWLALTVATTSGCLDGSDDSTSASWPDSGASFLGGALADAGRDGALPTGLGIGSPDAAASLDAALQPFWPGAPDAHAPSNPGDSGAPPAHDAAPEAGPVNLAQKFVGNITTNGQVRSDFADYWDQITPENEGKWGTVEAQHNQMNWSGLDRVHDYAKQHGLVFKQHNFVWGSQQPSWLSGMPAAQQRAEVEEWIRLFCERYPDVALIDVVNEPPPHTTPVYMEALGGAGSSGYDWIVQAFKWARQYCPNAKLILNDYNTIEYSADNSHFIAIVKAIKAAGAPIDAVGAQAHDAYKLPTGTVQGLLDQLAAGTGLPVYISEYDINLPDDARQQQVMQSQLSMFWNHQAVHGITLWGYIVGATWRSDTGLMTSSGAKRPALTWLLDFLGRPAQPHVP